MTYVCLYCWLVSFSVFYLRGILLCMRETNLLCLRLSLFVCGKEFEKLGEVNDEFEKLGEV